MWSYLTARIYDRVMAGAEQGSLGRWREDLLGLAHGDVLEIGAGTGANLRYYSSAVSRLVLTEPGQHMRTVLKRKLQVGTPDAEVVGCRAESLPFADATFDCVVMTLVLCTVDSPTATLAEVRRVLRQGGRLFFIEHVSAGEGSWTARAQALVQPLWRLAFGNCHLCRDTRTAIRAADFEFEQLEHAGMIPAPRLVRACIRGIARREE